MVCISFGSKGYNQQLNIWKQSFELQGFETICYNENDLDWLNNFIYGTRGYGYWIWKPYLILKTLETHNSVFYTDADYCLIDRGRLEDICSNYSQLLFELEPFHKNKFYIKQDCYYFMGAEEDLYYEDIMCEAGIQYWENTKENLVHLRKILGLCMNRAMISDDNNVCGKNNHPEYRGDHRHDQAILSLYKRMYELNTKSVYKLQGIIGGIL